MEPLKAAFSTGLLRQIAAHISRHLPGFAAETFVATISPQLAALELKQRSQLITDHLHAVLPPALDERFALVRAILHPETAAEFIGESDDRGLRGWAVLPFSALIGQHGLPAFDAALDLLREMTSRFSSEFDVRYYLLADQDRALAIMRRWVNDPDHHVRRLVSEGCRPRLPWAMRLPAFVADPAPILPLLMALRDDPQVYVRRSVANNLNDISKDHPDLVAGLAMDWLRGAPVQRAQMLRHACRGLIKAGHPTALRAFGIQPPMVNVSDFQILTPSVRLGETLKFSVTLASTAAKDQNVLIDYVLHFRRANGTLSAKVFKWKELRLAADHPVTLGRTHPIHPITTRRYYPGPQALSLRINGQDTESLAFVLAGDSPANGPSKIP